jgi:hypothetical protein
MALRHRINFGEDFCNDSSCNLCFADTPDSDATVPVKKTRKPRKPRVKPIVVDVPKVAPVVLANRPDVSIERATRLASAMSSSTSFAALMQKARILDESGEQTDFARDWKLNRRGEPYPVDEYADAMKERDSERKR